MSDLKVKRYIKKKRFVTLANGLSGGRAVLANPRAGGGTYRGKKKTKERRPVGALKGYRTHSYVRASSYMCAKVLVLTVSVRHD